MTLQSAVPTFFMTVLGIESVDLSCSATADYVKPVRLVFHRQHGQPHRSHHVVGEVSGDHVRLIK
ncbi:MAG: hypothetical protein OEX04_12565 [Acidimicrobiia bacterium]|nr:hypothetical protein [Acidimicrobiia bacterium]MDH4308301.1 hypothetical protein [Acidimicrobiia bacterium]MDH5293114.1 hypothetical protein [Acidimicrobiia bacterium]